MIFSASKEVSESCANGGRGRGGGANDRGKRRGEYDLREGTTRGREEDRGTGPKENDQEENPRGGGRRKRRKRNRERNR